VLEEVLGRPPPLALPEFIAPPLPDVLRQAHRTLEDVQEAFLREWLKLEEERGRLRTWHQNLEDKTRSASSSHLQERRKLEEERRALEEDRRSILDRQSRVFQRESEVTTRRGGLTRQRPG
jgi:seryl-tRNA synthetase